MGDVGVVIHHDLGIERPGVAFLQILSRPLEIPHNPASILGQGHLVIGPVLLFREILSAVLDGEVGAVSLIGPVIVTDLRRGGGGNGGKGRWIGGTARRTGQGMHAHSLIRTVQYIEEMPLGHRLNLKVE